MAELHAVYASSARFVWLTLQRLGVRKHDLEDVCHDVFLIAHRKLRDYDDKGKINAWLFGICVRVAANYRRRAHIRLEHATGVFDGDTHATLAAPDWARPDLQASRHEHIARAEAVLNRMSPIKRAVLLMFEVEGLSCQAIADELGLPVGTVYSRLNAARKVLARELGDDEGGRDA
jgi:RNA polymerase sigma-70 factor (ECF subfamily)